MTRGRKPGGTNPGVKIDRPLQTRVTEEVETFYLTMAEAGQRSVAGVLRDVLTAYAAKHKGKI
jgi:hypothetical protein